MLVKGIVLLAAGLLAGLVMAVLLADGTADEAPSEPVVGSGTGTATASAEATEVATPGGRAGPGAGTPPSPGGAPAVFASQAPGMRGCGQPVFLTAAGLPARRSLRVERADLGGEFVTFSSTAAGVAAVDAGSLFDTDCDAGREYTLRILDAAGGDEVARTSVEVPLFRGTIEVTPASGGCASIVVTVRGMPANAMVRVLATDVAPFANEGSFVLPEPLVSDELGFAQSTPVAAPWPCDAPARSLVAFASGGAEGRTREAELLYRIALGPGEPLPGVERWFSSLGR